MLLLVISITAMAQQRTLEPQWTSISSNSPETFQTQLISSTENSIKVNVTVPGFYTTTVTTPLGEAVVITVPKSVSTAHAGEPDMPMTGIPVMIGDKANMNVRVIDAQYIDYENVEVAPSKGDFPRSIDPATVPYTYGDCYRQDAFFPASNVGLYDPYIIRDLRGQNIVIYPFAYNPVTKTLRVYYNMTVEMYKEDDHGTNVIANRRSNTVKLDPDFKSLYQRHFINYEASMDRYTPVDEEGDLLIICYDNFISSMTDFVNWKKTRGINTTIVGTSTAGSSYSAIQTYIRNQYNANNNLTHVLLVGDVAQIPGYSYSGGGSSYSGLGDNAYGQIVGSDYYNDVFIGRFSAQTAAQVTTQVNRVITYERDLTTSDTWLQKADGIARNEGGSGHNGEDDYEHMDVIRTDLLNYGYNTVYQDYENLSGYTGTASSISSHINSGVGIVNYCNHGNNQLWGVASYSNTQVNNLTNSNKLPFIWSVACLVGKYDNTSTSYGSNYTIGQNNDCFAEAWMHATYSSSDLTPTGAVGTLMSYISQPWIPPMWAQDECIDILAGLSSSGGTKHTWGGVSINGLFGIFDNYGTDQSAVGTYQAWILYGDPSMMLRTKTPQAMTVTHTGSLPLGNTTYSVTVSNGNGALATITDANHNILGKATVSNGTATITVSGNLTANQQLTLCVFGFNKVTYLGTITVQGGTQYAISASASPTAGGSVSGAGTYYENTQCTLTATANNHYEFSSWTKNGSQVSTANPYTFMVTGTATYVANFTALSPHTVTCNTVQHGTISASLTSAYKGETVTLTATPATGYCLGSWTVKDANNNNITVTNNQFTMPDNNVTVSATFVVGYNVTLAPATNGTISANPTSGPAGTTITLTATPATGFLFDSWVVYKTGDANTTVTVTNNTFTLPSYDVTVVGVFLAPQGGDVTIGSGTTANSYLPTYTYYNYSLTQQIYTSAEVGDAGTITKVAFKVSNSKTTTRSLDLYLSHTSNTSISSNSGWISQSTSNRVFSGNVTFNASGWTTITLSSPFEYNGTSNLLLTVDDNTGSYVSSSSESPQFYTYSASDNTAIYKYNDNTNYSPASMSTSGTRIANKNQVVFTKEVPSTEGYLSVSPTSLTDFVATSGATASNPQSVAVVAANLQADLTVTAPNGYEVSTSQNGTFNSTLTLTPSNGSICANVYVRLSSNVSPGNYNGNMTMASGSTSATVSLSGTVLQGTGTSYAITATANPTAGGTVTGAGTYYENGTCTLTATANTGYSFTNWTKNGSVVSTSSSYSFTVNENNAGEYVANFTINSYLVTATANPAEGGTISGTGSYNHGTTVSLTATANEGYTFTNWTKNGVSVSTNATYNFTVTDATAVVANFTINSYDVTATANPTEGGTVTVGAPNRDDLVYDFEDGWQGWTAIKGSTGTSTHNWMHNTEYYAFDSNGNQIVPECHNSTSGMMLSESYISNSASGASDATAVYPDNYLVSPQFRLGGSFTFYAASRMSNYPAEKFSVLVSTTGNTSVGDFTHTELTVTLSDNSWNEYTIDLSDYSGMGYVAIRHYDCYDQHLLYVDDVTIVEGQDSSNGSGNFNYGETCTVTATPNTDYYFVNWTENGTAVSSDASYSFTVTGDRDLVANFSQTLPCYVPTELAASDVDHQSAVLNWNGEADSWKVAYMLSTASQFTEVTVNTNSYTMTELLPETSYTVKVAAVCGDETLWCDPISFTTLSMPCPAPSVLTAANVTSTSASLSWTETGTATSWVLQYGTDDAFANDTYTEMTVNGTPAAELVDLTAETEYYARVKSACSATNQSGWSNTCTFLPSIYVVIGSGTGTDNYLPTNVNNKYSMTQQIYTAEELGEAGNIVSLDFYKNNNVVSDRKLDIYMVSTDKSSFTGTNDWIPVTAANKVFSGTVNFNDNAWTTITLDRPFRYEGTSNVAIVVDDNTGLTKSSTPFLVFPASNQAIRISSNTTNYNAVSAGNYIGTVMSSKNQMRIVKGELGPFCPEPTDVAVSVTGRHSAVVTWTENGEADAWVVAYRPATDNLFTEMEVSENTYAMTGLSIGTSYVVKVRPICDNVTESWSEEMMFTTDGCYTISLETQESGEWTENFDTYTDVTTAETGIQPDCWEVTTEEVSLNGATMPQVYYNANFATSGSYTLRMKNRCVYAMPALDENVEVTALKMTFSLRQPKTVYRLQVGLVNEDGEFELVKTINNASEDIEQVTVNFSDYDGNGRRIAFRNSLSSGSSLTYSVNYIDDIVISYANSCAITVLSHSENFDGYTNVTVAETGVQPECWEVIPEDVALNGTTKPQVYYNTTYATSGSYVLRMKNRCTLAMPELSSNISVSDLTMTFNLRQSNSKYRLQVGVLNDEGEFTLVKTIKCNGTNTMEAKSVDFSGYTGGGHRIAFRNTLVPGTGMSTTYLDYSVNYIDDINLDYIVAAKNDVNDENVIDMNADLENIEVYPNPTKDYVNVQCTMNNVQSVEVIDVYGKVVNSLNVTDNQTRINVSGLAAGMYFVRVTTENGAVTKPFVKR